MEPTMQDIRNPGLCRRTEGFPHAPGDWDITAADDLARSEGISPGADHWETIRALHEYYVRHDRPNARELHDALEEKFHAKGGIRYLYQLFPQGPLAQGCRMAGLEPPAGSADRSFGSVQ